MSSTSIYINNMNCYKKCIRLFESANYVFLDEISKFKFKKISGYYKSKKIYDKVIHDFKLVNQLIEQKDLSNAAVVLRQLYENIIYIIATSYDKNIKVNLNTQPIIYRKVLENNCNTIFSDFFESEDFNEVYKYLSKIIHPCSLKEMVSYMEKNPKYSKYLLANLKYLMIYIQYMYLNFLNKKINNYTSILDLDFIHVCTYSNLLNLNCFIKNSVNDTSFIKKFLFYDLDNKYIKDNQECIKEVYSYLNDNKEHVELDIKNVCDDLDKLLKVNNYNEVVGQILSGKNRIGVK